MCVSVREVSGVLKGGVSMKIIAQPDSAQIIVFHIIYNGCTYNRIIDS